MTQTVDQTLNTGSHINAHPPASRKEAAGRTAFELLLSMELANQVPMSTNSDRFASHVKAQEERDAERTGRPNAQQSQHAGRAERNGTGQNGAGTTSNVASGASSGVLANKSVQNSDQSIQDANLKSDSSSKLGQVPGSSAPSEAKAKQDGGDEAANSRRRSHSGGAFGALLRQSSSARSVVTSNRSSSVLAVKAGGSGGSPIVTSAVRDGARISGTVRSRAQSPMNRPNSFQVEQQKMFAQVGRGLAAALKREGGEITLRLKPETLGELKIKLELNQGRVNAIFRADNDSARQLLESSLDALKSSLEAKGLRVDRLFVESPDDPGHKQNGSQGEPNDREQTPGGDRDPSDDGDRPRQSPRMAHNVAGSGPQADAEAPVDQNDVSDARIAEDSTQQSGLVPGEDEMLVRVRLDAVA